VVLFPGAKRRQTGPQAFRHTSTYIFVPTSFFPLAGGCLELLQKQQEMKYQPNWMGEIIETMDWG
jgi:muramoyltetrapeptide carboxypeptidase LdcA involved in peptidoglycan recycling